MMTEMLMGAGAAGCVLLAVVLVVVALLAVGLVAWRRGRVPAAIEAVEPEAVEPEAVEPEAVEPEAKLRFAEPEADEQTTDVPLPHELPARPPAPPAAVAAVHPVAAALAFDHFDDPDPDAAHRKASALLFDAVSDALAKPKQVLPDQVDDEAELRGRVQDIPMRLILEGEGDWRVEARVADILGGAAFYYDPSLAPVAADPDDDFADQDQIRVFVAKGLYVEGDPEVVEIAMQFIATIEPEDVERIRAAMEALPFTQVWYGVDELYIYGGKLREADDPVAVCRAALELAGWLGSRVTSSEATGSLSQVQCAFCGSRYFFGVRRGACPNCGAPPGA